MTDVSAFTAGDQRGMGKLNNALIVFLPKQVRAMVPSDFQPIPMIYSFAKLISKILTLRLEKNYTLQFKICSMGRGHAVQEEDTDAASQD
jgi:hypothetical protein